MRTLYGGSGKGLWNDMKNAPRTSNLESGPSEPSFPYTTATDRRREGGIEIADVVGPKLRRLAVLIPEWRGVPPITFSNREGGKDRDGVARRAKVADRDEWAFSKKKNNKPART